MPGHQDVWRTETGGGLSAEVGAYRLVARVPEDARGSVRCMVPRLAEGDDGPPALVDSGTEPDVRAAMKKATRMADRLVGAPPGSMRRAVSRPSRVRGPDAPSGPPGAIRVGAAL